MKRVRATALISSFGASVKRLILWFGERFKDLFYATGNTNMELGRSVTGILTSLIVFSVWWNAVKLGQAIDLGALLTGLAAFITAAGLGIAAKDWVRNNAEKFSKTVTTVMKKVEQDVQDSDHP